MGINKINNNVSFKGMIPYGELRNLALQKTPESKKMLQSCLQFNAVYRGIEKINPDKVARELEDKYKILAKFGDNPYVAAFSALTANIFDRLNLTQPSNILLKDFSRTSCPTFFALCVTGPCDGAFINDFGKAYPLRTIILNKAVNWSDIQHEMIRLRKKNSSATPHFLDIFIHEAVHSAHLDNLMRRHPNGVKTMEKIQKRFKNKETIDMIKKETSDYAFTNPVEFIAEEMTQLIVDSLNPKTLLPDKAIFQKGRQSEPFDMDKLIDACWSGDVKQVNEYRKRKYKFLEYLKNMRNSKS